MNASLLVNTLLEVVEPDAKAVRRQLKKMFVPGSRWTRVNYRFPTSLLDREQPNIAVKKVPAATPISVTVHRVIPDSVVFILPDGQYSHLAWPDLKLTQAYFIYPTGLELHDARGLLLRYTPA